MGEKYLDYHSPMLNQIKSDVIYFTFTQLHYFKNGLIHILLFHWFLNKTGHLFPGETSTLELNFGMPWSAESIFIGLKIWDSFKCHYTAFRH